MEPFCFVFFLFYWAQNVFNLDSVMRSVLSRIFTYIERSYMWSSFILYIVLFWIRPYKNLIIISFLYMTLYL